MQLLTESILLAIMGGLAGLIVARWTLDLILWLLPGRAADSLPVQGDDQRYRSASGRRVPVAFVPTLQS